MHSPLLCHSQVTLNGRSGLIPSNYVQIIDSGLPFAGESESAFAVGSKLELTEISHTSEVAVKLTSLEAFDDLMDNGFTVVDSEPSSFDECIKEGQTVHLDYTLCVWDGSSSKAREKERAQGCCFTVGVLDPYFAPDSVSPDPACGVPPPPGLHDALQSLGESASATVVLAPETAFGAEGLPFANIPEIAHLVYFLRVTQVTGQPCSVKAATTNTEQPGRSTAGQIQDKSALAKSISARYGAWTSHQSSRTSFAPHAGRSASGGTSAAASARSIAPAQHTQSQHTSGSGSKSLHELSPEEAEAVVRARIAAMDGGGASSPPAAPTESTAGFKGILGNMFGQSQKADRDKEISIAPASSGSIVPPSRPGPRR